MGKIYFGNIQQTRRLDNEVAERVEVFMYFRHFFGYQLMGLKSNLSSKEIGGIFTGAAYSSDLKLD